MKRQARATVVTGLAMLLALPLPAQTGTQQDSSGQSSSNQNTGFVLRAETDLVLTNVVVRDSKTGRVVEGLKQSDFTHS